MTATASGALRRLFLAALAPIVLAAFPAAAQDQATLETKLATLAKEEAWSDLAAQDGFEARMQLFLKKVSDRRADQLARMGRTQNCIRAEGVAIKNACSAASLNNALTRFGGWIDEETTNATGTKRLASQRAKLTASIRDAYANLFPDDDLVRTAKSCDPQCQPRVVQEVFKKISSPTPGMGVCLEDLNSCSVDSVETGEINRVTSEISKINTSVPPALNNTRQIIAIIIFALIIVSVAAYWKRKAISKIYGDISSARKSRNTTPPERARNINTLVNRDPEPIGNDSRVDSPAPTVVETTLSPASDAITEARVIAMFEHLLEVFSRIADGEDVNQFAVPGSSDLPWTEAMTMSVQKLQAAILQKQREVREGIEEKRNIREQADQVGELVVMHRQLDEARADEARADEASREAREVLPEEKASEERQIEKPDWLPGDGMPLQTFSGGMDDSRTANTADRSWEGTAEPNAADSAPESDGVPQADTDRQTDETEIEITGEQAQQAPAIVIDDQPDSAELMPGERMRAGFVRPTVQVLEERIVDPKSREDILVTDRAIEAFFNTLQRSNRDAHDLAAQRYRATLKPLDDSQRRIIRLFEAVQEATIELATKVRRSALGDLLSDAKLDHIYELDLPVEGSGTVPELVKVCKDAGYGKKGNVREVYSAGLKTKGGEQIVKPVIAFS